MSDEAPERVYPAHVPDRCKAGLDVANAGKPLAALNGVTDQVLERLRNGERVVDLAAEYGVGHPKLYEWLIRHCPEEWAAVSAGRALAKMETAETDLDAADDKTQIMKAREARRMGEWTLERVARKIYGDVKQENTGTVIQVYVARDGEVRVIDGEAA